MLYPISYLESLDREGFTNPFRYCPHLLVRLAAAEVLSRLEEWKERPNGSYERELERSFAEGKMLGVLICRKPDSDGEYSPSEGSAHHNGKVTPLFYLAAFSGTVREANGRVTATIDGFVPPIIDLTEDDGYFKLKEAEISQINHRISELSSSDILRDMRAEYKRMLVQQESQISAMQEQIRQSKIRREEIRRQSSDAAVEKELIKESQFQKGQLKRLKDRWKEVLAETAAQISAVEIEISTLKRERARKSVELQKWIFENALVHNACGRVSSIWNVFECRGLVPPGGTGECAAPKLLEYAYRNGLEPLAMGEFWYGLSPETAVRTHGHFYPSCTSKCGPLLGYMMQGLENISGNKTVIKPADHIHEDKTAQQIPIIIHEDESVIVVEKPSGMPSVPGLDGRKSLQEWLLEQREEIYSVHRLDMDTSGVMVFAKTSAAAACLQKQFEEHTICKTYMARVTPCPLLHHLTQTEFKDRPSGSIDLPLSPDYDERPRQKVDFKQGKQAHTEYENVREYADGTADLLLYPHTGRTHQLRVHCAHTLGLGRPILGDLLYGAYTTEGRSAGEGCAKTEGRSAGEGCAAEPIKRRLGVGPTPFPEPNQPNQPNPSRLCLHALSLTFRHPDTDAPLTFTSSLLCH